METVSTGNAGEMPEEVEPARSPRRNPIPKDATPGTLLLRAPGELFDRISKGEDLVPMIRYFAVFTAVFAAIYGGALGFYAGGWQISAAAAKMPVLLLLSLLICLPALFTFNVILGSTLSFLQCAAVLSMSAYLMATILGSFAPILLFFAISAGGHDFISLLNLIMCSISGAFGIVLIWRAMRHLAESGDPEPDLLILKIWMLIFSFVGAQMSWILRPFVGSPDQFALYRKIESNFFVAVGQLLGDVFR